MSVRLFPPVAGGCGEGFFQCKRGGCIEERATCDGTDDCGDGTDEVNCGQCAHPIALVMIHDVYTTLLYDGNALLKGHMSRDVVMHSNSFV